MCERKEFHWDEVWRKLCLRGDWVERGGGLAGIVVHEKLWDLLWIASNAMRVECAEWPGVRRTTHGK